MTILERLKRKPRYDVLAGLAELRREFPDPVDQGYIGDMELYAHIGRDRKKLGEEFVAETRRQLESNPWKEPW